MERISKKDILDIIKQIESEFEKDDIMSVYECFDFCEEDNDKIAKYLSNAINSKCYVKKLS